MPGLNDIFWIWGRCFGSVFSFFKGMFRYVFVFAVAFCRYGFDRYGGHQNHFYNIGGTMYCLASLYWCYISSHASQTHITWRFSKSASSYQILRNGLGLNFCGLASTTCETLVTWGLSEAWTHFREGELSAQSPKTAILGRRGRKLRWLWVKTNGTILG